ncbi:MAG TPA: hypothetical protein VN662_07575 [Rhodanobacteraceae bacterium]|nr:hypothetical protein [Rhodanobacteraceae bacterium]
MFAELARCGWGDDEFADLAGRNLSRAMRGATGVASTSRHRHPHAISRRAP